MNKFTQRWTKKTAILRKNSKNVKVLHFSALQLRHPDSTLTDNQFSSNIGQISEVWDNGQTENLKSFPLLYIL